MAKTFEEIDREQSRERSKNAGPVLPDNWESLPDAPMRDGELPCAQREAVSSIRADMVRVTEAERVYASRISVLIGAKNFAAAKLVIDEAERADACDVMDTLFLESSLAETGLDEKVLGTLERGADIYFVGDLAGVTNAELMAINGFGAQSLDILWWTILQFAALRDDRRAAAERELLEVTR